MTTQSKNVGDLFRHITQYTGKEGGIYGDSVLAYCRGAKTKELASNYSIDIAVRKGKMNELFRNLGIRSGSPDGRGKTHGILTHDGKNYPVSVKEVDEKENPVERDHVAGDIEYLGWNEDGVCSWSREFDVKELKQKVERGEFSVPPWSKGDVHYKLSQHGFNKVEMTKKEVKKMANGTKPTTMETLKHTMNEAKFRVAATQTVKGGRAAILTILKKQGMDDGKLAGFAAFMETEFGTAIVSGILGMALPHAPVIGNNPHIQKLCDEFRIQSMATVGNELIGVAMSELLPVVSTALSNLPSVEEEVKARVSEGNSTDTGTVEDMVGEENEEKETAKQMKAGGM